MFQIQVCEILNEKDVYKEIDIDHDYKERYSTLPCVGTRVRKGRDWRYDSGDCCDTGTVIGHREQGIKLKKKLFTFTFFFGISIQQEYNTFPI